MHSADKPFKTIQACVNYICDTYNVSRYVAVIKVAAGTYDAFNLGDFSSTTGRIEISRDGDGDVLIYAETPSKAAINISGGTWYLRNLKLEAKITQGGEEYSSISSVALVSNGVASFYDCDFTMTCSAESMEHPITGRMIWAYDSANVYLNDISNVEAHGGITTITFIIATSNAVITLNAGNANLPKCIIQGEFGCVAEALSEGMIKANTNGAINRFVFEIPDGKEVTGKRYQCLSGGKIETNSSGPDFFPGSKDGTVESSTYCWYK